MKSSRSSLAGLIAMAAGLMTGQAAIGTDRKPRETDNWGPFRQHTNPERNARRKFKRQVGARQARRQLCTSYQLRDAYKIFDALGV